VVQIAKRMHSSWMRGAGTLVLGAVILVFSRVRLHADGATEKGASGSKLGKEAAERASVVIEGIRSGWKSMRTFHFVYRREVWHDRKSPEGETAVYLGEIFGKDGKIRNKADMAFQAGQRDMAWDTFFDGVDYKSYHKPKGDKSQAEFAGVWKPAGSEGQLKFDEYLSTLLLATVSDGQTTPTADWLAESLVKDVRVKDDNVWGKLWQIDCEARPGSNYQTALFTVIPQKNFPILRAEFHARAPWDDVTIEKFSEFRDYRGILFASRAEIITKSHTKSENGIIRETTFKDAIDLKTADINGAVDDREFAFEFPAGMRVLDFRTKTVYQWPRGSGWEQPFAEGVNTATTRSASGTKRWAVISAVAVGSAVVLASLVFLRRTRVH
jgi:hypothetical protein